MNKASRTYIAIDLKSFYASVECQIRGLDPLTTNLVVADASRTEKTICLAVSPSLKSVGIPGRPRLFEVVQKTKEINQRRLRKLSNQQWNGTSHDSVVLSQHPDYALSYIVAPPQMALYIEYSTRIYNVYLKYVAPEDIHVYSIDEVFMDVTGYLNTYQMSARQLTETMLQDVLQTTGITATAGIGTNLYLAKVAMDIVAKHLPADKHGVRIAELNELSYRHKLWSHRPLTDFWRIGPGYARKLEACGMYTMGDIARCSLQNEDFLYSLFGKNTELLIDHAWGYEPCTIEDIQSYTPSANSLGSGQVLHEPYTNKQARIIVWEMADALALDLVSKQLVSNQFTLTIGYDMQNLNNPSIAKQYTGPIVRDMYGRKMPKHAHGTVRLEVPTSSTKKITEALCNLYDSIGNPLLTVRRLHVCCHHVIQSSQARKFPKPQQLDLFTDYESVEEQENREKIQEEKEVKIQKTLLKIKQKYGKNAVLKATNLQEKATAKDRNQQIGGHKA